MKSRARQTFSVYYSYLPRPLERKIFVIPQTCIYELRTTSRVNSYCFPLDLCFLTETDCVLCELGKDFYTISRKIQAETWVNCGPGYVTHLLISLFLCLFLSLSLSLFLSFLVWLLLPPHCRCRRSMLHLITLNDMHTQSVGILRASDQPKTHTPLPDNTQHSQQTDIHAHSNIRNRNPRKRVAPDIP
jgi:hypothetical protein